MKIKTINLKGKEYATVPARIKEFREQCPRGAIKTKPEFMEGGQVIFKAHVVKDKTDSGAAEATGHAIGDIKGDKNFEKLETVAVGRALANLGFLASGEVASAEEMEEFYSYQEERKQEAIADALDSMNQAKDLVELRQSFVSLGPVMKESEVIALKDKLKKQFTQEDENTKS